MSSPFEKKANEMDDKTSKKTVKLIIITTVYPYYNTFAVVSEPK